MLILSRKKNGRIAIGDNVVITIVGINGDKVRIGIDAPLGVEVDRMEVRHAKEAKKNSRLRGQVDE